VPNSGNKPPVSRMRMEMVQKPGFKTLQIQSLVMTPKVAKFVDQKKVKRQTLLPTSRNKSEKEGESDSRLLG